MHYEERKRGVSMANMEEGQKHAQTGDKERKGSVSTANMDEERWKHAQTHYTCLKALPKMRQRRWVWRTWTKAHTDWKWGEKGVGMSTVSTDESTWIRDEQTKGAVSTENVDEGRKHALTGDEKDESSNFLETRMQRRVWVRQTLIRDDKSTPYLETRREWGGEYGECGQKMEMHTAWWMWNTQIGDQERRGGQWVRQTRTREDESMHRHTIHAWGWRWGGKGLWVWQMWMKMNKRMHKLEMRRERGVCKYSKDGWGMNDVVGRKNNKVACWEIRNSTWSCGVGVQRIADLRLYNLTPHPLPHQTASCQRTYQPYPLWRLPCSLHWWLAVVHDQRWILRVNDHLQAASVWDGAVMPPTFLHGSLYSTSGNSIVSLSSDSKYPADLMTTECGLVAYAYNPSTDDNIEDDMHDPREWKEGSCPMARSYQCHHPCGIDSGPSLLVHHLPHLLFIHGHED